MILARLGSKMTTCLFFTVTCGTLLMTWGCGPNQWKATSTILVSNGPFSVVQAAAQAPGVEAAVKKKAGVLPTTPAVFEINNAKGTNVLQIDVEANDGVTAAKLSNAMARYLINQTYLTANHTKMTVQLVQNATVPQYPQHRKL